MSLLDVSARKPIMVFCHKPTKGFASRTVWENRLRFNFETFITFSVPSFSQFECTTQNFVYCLYCLTCLHRIQKIAYATNSFFFLSPFQYGATFCVLSVLCCMSPYKSSTYSSLQHNFDM